MALFVFEESLYIIIDLPDEAEFNFFSAVKNKLFTAYFSNVYICTF